MVCYCNRTLKHVTLALGPRSGWQVQEPGGDPWWNVEGQWEKSVCRLENAMCLLCSPVWVRMSSIFIPLDSPASIGSVLVMGLMWSQRSTCQHIHFPSCFASVPCFSHELLWISALALGPYLTPGPAFFTDESALFFTIEKTELPHFIHGQCFNCFIDAVL